MADPTATSIVIPAFNEGAAIARGRAARCARPRAWHEILVVDDGSTDDTGAHAAAAGAARRAASVQQGQRRLGQDRASARATGEYVLILDGDGQHKPEDALPPASRPRRVRSGGRRARRARRRRSGRRRIGNARAQLAGRLPHRARHPGSDLGLPRRAPRVPARVPPPAAERVLDADDDDPGFIRAGYNVRFEPVEAPPAHRHSKIRLARDGVKFFLIMLRDRSRSSARCGSSCRSASASFTRRRRSTAVWNDRPRTRHIPNGAVLLLMFAVIVFLVGLVSEQISALRVRSEAVAAVTSTRRAAVLAGVARRARAAARVRPRLLDRQAADPRRARVPRARPPTSAHGRGFTLQANCRRGRDGRRRSSSAARRAIRCSSRR